MSKRLPITERRPSLRSYAIDQTSFIDGIWKDIPAVSVPGKGLSDGENIVIDELGGILGRPGTHALTEPLSGEPLALAYIPKAADGNAYFVSKVNNELFCSTHDPSTPAYFLDWTTIKSTQGYATDPNHLGSGLDDLHIRGQYSGDVGTFYYVEIDGTGSPNTLKWSNDGGSSWEATGVPITGNKQTLENDLEILFDATTGHTMGDQWYFYAYPPATPALEWGKRATFSSYGDKLVLHDSEKLLEVYYDTDKSKVVYIWLNCGVTSSYSSSWTSTADGTGSYYRRYTYTLARVEDGVITHECEPYVVYWVLGGVPVPYIYKVFRNSTPMGSTSIQIGGLPDLTHIGGRKHWTHLVLYSTVNITYRNDDQTDLITNGADDELFVFNGLTELENGNQEDTTAIDSASDTVLNARLEAGDVLKSRYLKPIVNGSKGGMVKDFLFNYDINTDKIHYCSASSPHPKHLGYSHQDQWLKGQGSVNAIVACGSNAAILGDQTTGTVNVTSYEFGGESIAPVPIFGLPNVASTSIGVPGANVGTIALMEGESFVAVTNDGLRIFDGFKWSADITHKRFNKEIRNIPEGAVGVFGNGKYYLWYRSSAGQSSYNDRCIVVNLRDKHMPWSKITSAEPQNSGTAFPMPGLYVGGIAAEYQGRTLTCCFRRHYGSNTDRRIYWIDTFDSNSNAILSREPTDQYYVGTTGYTANISCNWETRDWTGETEQHKLVSRNLYCKWSVDPEAGAYLPGFQGDMTFIQDGIEKETVTQIKTDSTEVEEISASWGTACNRLRIRFRTNKTNFLFRGYRIDVDERKELAASVPNWVELQRNLGSSLLQYIASGYMLFDEFEYGGNWYSGKIKERWNGRSLNFVDAGGNGVFQRVVGPDGRGGSGISVVRNTSGGILGFQGTATTPFRLSSLFSFMVWARLSSGSFQDVVTFSPDLTIAQYVRLSGINGTIRLQDSSGNYITWSADLSAWALVAVVYQTGTYTAYVNGVSATQTGSSGTIAQPTDYYGLTVANPTTVENVDFFEFRHYMRALNADELLYHYTDVVSNSGKATLPMR